MCVCVDDFCERLLSPRVVCPLKNDALVVPFKLDSKTASQFVQSCVPRLGMINSFAIPIQLTTLPSNAIVKAASQFVGRIKLFHVWA